MKGKEAMPLVVSLRLAKEEREMLDFIRDKMSDELGMNLAVTDVLRILIRKKRKGDA